MELELKKYIDTIHKNTQFKFYEEHKKIIFKSTPKNIYKIRDILSIFDNKCKLKIIMIDGEKIFEISWNNLEDLDI